MVLYSKNNIKLTIIIMSKNKNKSSQKSYHELIMTHLKNSVVLKYFHRKWNIVKLLKKKKTVPNARWDYQHSKTYRNTAIIFI